MDEARADPAPAGRIGRYELRGQIAPGPPPVYAALDALVERSVALTRLALDPGDPAAMQQVLRQARTWAGFSHLNVGSLFDVFEHGGAVYVAAELVEGKTLAAALTSAVPLHPASVLEWMAQLAGALDSIHKAGLLHGNVTPSSIVIEPLPRLWEFDVACVPTGTGRVRAGGDASPYWSPEQRAGNALDRRADLFSFALCVYQALSGAPELPPVAVASIGQRLREGDAALPDLEALGVAREGWRDVFATALAADPAERYATGAAFAGALSGVLRLSDYVAPAGAEPAAQPTVVLGRQDTGAIRVDDVLRRLPASPPPPAPPAAARSSEVPAPGAPRSSPGGGVIGAVADAGAGLLRGAARLVEKVLRVVRAGEASPELAREETSSGAVASAAPTADELLRERSRHGGGPGLETSVEPGPDQSGGVVVDPVDATVFAPSAVRQGDSLLVQVVVHTPEQAVAALTLARDADESTKKRGFRSLAARVARGSRLAFDLQMPGLVVEDPAQSLLWNGRPEAVQFGVTVPADRPPGAVLGTVTAWLDSVPIGHVKFTLAVRAASEAPALDDRGPVGEQARRYAHVFISYASKDRPAVLARVQVLKPLGISYFQDLLSLDPGDRWERKLYEHIDTCDLFLLFWSSSAKASEWVMKEVRYAIARKSGDDLAAPEIRPIVIEGPPPVPPPPELAHLHFNDPLLYFMSTGRG